MSSQTILVVEDHANEREALMRMLRLEGYEVMGASTLVEARAFSFSQIDLVITDLRLGKHSGLELLKYLRETKPSTPLLVVTAFGDVETAVSAMKLGAVDYLSKPLKPDHLLLLVNRYLPMRQTLVGENAADRVGLGNMIGNSPQMLRIYELIYRVAESDAIVLITGESGTGKELVAAAVHGASKRRNGPFVAINVAALPDALVEAELFGHVRGAFTGANESRQGRIEAAQDGTLFMDEVGDLPLQLQPKLLRVLENYQIAPIGSNKELKVDVRLIAATSRNIPDMIDKNQFRSDLFHRLNVLAIDLPPLRERPEDIRSLVEHFLKDCATRYMRSIPNVSVDLMKFFEGYEWPGNVRQLKNTIENLFVMGDRELLGIQDLPKSLGGSASILPIQTTIDTLSLSDVERATILSALRMSMGNRTHAAQKLGISVRTLQRKLRQWQVDEFPSDDTANDPSRS